MIEETKSYDFLLFSHYNFSRENKMYVLLS